MTECGEIGIGALAELSGRYGVGFALVPAGAAIPASYWGEPEAGLRGNTLYARLDTPVHSVLHELSHFVCMSGVRRASLDRDAGSDDAEECAVCYLQIALAPYLQGYGKARCCDDMDAWGYSFREGAVRDWIAGDGRDARAWLSERALIDSGGEPTWRLCD